jgi:hypothetical protein
MAEQAVVAAAVCEGSLESFRGLMGDLVDMEGVIVGLAMYMVLSLVWGLARVVYFWKKGPTRGHFPPDELVARLVLAILGACLKLCRAGWADAAPRGEEPTPTARAALAADLRRRLTATCSSGEESEYTYYEEVEVPTTGLAGPAFNLPLSAILPPLERVPAASLVQPVCANPSPVLVDRTEEWVEETAARKEASVPSLSTSVMVEPDYDLEDVLMDTSMEAVSGHTVSEDRRSEASQGLEEVLASSILDRTAGDLNATLTPADSTNDTVSKIY